MIRWLSLEFDCINTLCLTEELGIKINTFGRINEICVDVGIYFRITILSLSFVFGFTKENTCMSLIITKHLLITEQTYN